MRAVPFLALTVVSLALAACGDTTTAPDTAPQSRPAAEIDAPNQVLVTDPGLGFTAYLTARIVDIHGKTIPETSWMRFSRYPYIYNQSFIELKDNSDGDLDPTVGVVKVKLIKGVSYEACHTKKSWNYTAVSGNPMYPVCRTIKTDAFNIDFGSLYARKAPRVTWTFKDEFGSVLPGASIDLKLGSNWQNIVTDGDGMMDGPTPNGAISIQISEQQVAWCVAKAPYKYEAITNKCGSFLAKWENDYNFTILNRKLIY